MKTKSLKPPTGQKLADDLARMMGWKLKKEVVLGGIKLPCWVVGHRVQILWGDWNPTISYDRCRIVEDWVRENGLSQGFFEKLWKIYDNRYIQSTALERCQAAWLAWKESNK